MANNILSVTDGDYGYPSNKLAPLVQGQYGQSLPIEIHDLAGNIVNLTGYSVLSATKRAASGNVTAIVGTIALSGTPSVAPQLTWTIAEEDTGVAGKFDLVLSLSNGSVVYETHPVELKIASNPAANAVAAPGLLSVTAEQRAWLASAVEESGNATGGNLVQWNNDGTIADSGRAKTEIGNATTIRARPVADVVPTDGQVLTYDTTNGWQPETPSAGGAVDSVFGRTGAVIAASGDYLSSQITDNSAYGSGGALSDSIENLSQDIGIAVAGAQPVSAKLTALDALAWAANSIVQLTSTSAAAVVTLAAHVWTFLQSADAAAARSAIGALPEDAGIVAVSAGRDLATTDAGKILECSGTFAVNCPNGLDAGFQCAIAPISGTVTLTATTTLQYWSGGALVTASGAVTLNAMVTVYHAGSNVWRVAGDVTE